MRLSLRRGNFQGQVGGAPAQHAGRKGDDAHSAPPALEVKSRDDDQRAGRDAQQTIRVSDVAFHDCYPCVWGWLN